MSLYLFVMCKLWSSDTLELILILAEWDTVYSFH